MKSLPKKREIQIRIWNDLLSVKLFPSYFAEKFNLFKLLFCFLLRISATLMVRVLIFRVLKVNKVNALITKLSNQCFKNAKNIATL
jgi:hypothetical protein